MEEAQKIGDKLIKASEIYSFSELDKYHAHLTEFKSYTINGNVMWVGKCREQTTNGALTFSIIEIDKKSFSISQFIRERENCSSVFDIDDEKTEKFIWDNDYFIDIKAN